MEVAKWAKDSSIVTILELVQGFVTISSQIIHLDSGEVLQKFDEVITIAQSSKTWHFPMENLPALMLIPFDDLASPKTVLHVYRLSPLTLEWLGIVMGPNLLLCLEDVSLSRENCTRQGERLARECH